jgi:hypothetical protein
VLATKVTGCPTHTIGADGKFAATVTPAITFGSTVIVTDPDTSGDGSAQGALEVINT